MTFEVQDCGAQSVSLQTAILLYGQTGYQNISYATIHPVDCVKDGAPVIRAGRPADRDGCARPDDLAARGRWVR